MDLFYTNDARYDIIIDMSASNRRVREYGTIHHLTSRIAHRVFFLGVDEKNDLIEFIRRSIDFSGLKLLGWCILSNHFHLLVYLPEPVELSEEEIFCRYARIKGKEARIAAENRVSEWRRSGDEKRAEEWFASLKRRMNDIGEFMKMVKQWFTEEYNRRQTHCGTLWESVYHDRLVARDVKSMSRVLGYIHLNPIRAALSDSYDGYIWSSFAALCRKDEMALDGIRFVYNCPEGEREELISQHRELLDVLLEDVKRQRAEDIARRRLNGYEIPADPLTTEAMIAQAHEHLRVIQDAFISLKSKRAEGLCCSGEEVDGNILSILRAEPNANAETISSILGLQVSSIYEHLRKLKQNGVISRDSRRSPWRINP